MDFVTLSGTTLQASRVGLGTWAMGGWMWGGTDERESIWPCAGRWTSRAAPCVPLTALFVRRFLTLSGRSSWPRLHGQP